MTLITQYLIRQVLTGLFFLTAILVSGIWLTQSLRFVEIIVNRNISISDYFCLVSCLIPDLLSIILPVCILISVLFTYNKSLANHEITIYRSCGLSNWRLARPALVLAFVIACFVALINIYIVPLSFRNFRDMEYRLRNEFSSGFIQDGTFNTLRGVTVYARSRAGNGDLEGVFINSVGQGVSASGIRRKPFTIVAEQGTLVERDGKKTLLLLFKGTRQEKDEKTGKISFFHFHTLSYDLESLAVSIQERHIKPYERSLSDLLNPADVHTLSSSTKAQLRAETHQRLLSPLLVIAFTLMGLGTILPQRASRLKRQKRISLAIVTAAFIHMGLIFLININGQWYFSIPFAYIIIFFTGLSSLLVIEHQNIRSWWMRHIFPPQSPVAKFALSGKAQF